MVRPVMMHWQRHVSVVTNHVRPKIVNSAPWFGTVFVASVFVEDLSELKIRKRIFNKSIFTIEVNGRPGRHAHAAHFKRPEDERF